MVKRKRKIRKKKIDEEGDLIDDTLSIPPTGQLKRGRVLSYGEISQSGGVTESYFQSKIPVTIKIPITENNRESYNTRYEKLSDSAKKILHIMIKAHKVSGRNHYNFNYFRPIIKNWRRVLSLYFELESRGFGKVRKINSATTFILFKMTLRYIK